MTQKNLNYQTAKQLGEQLQPANDQFEQQNTDIEQVVNDLQNKLIKEAENRLQNQESKLERAKLMIAELTTSIFGLVEEKLANLDPDTQKENTAKLLILKAEKLVRTAVEAVYHQDAAASRVTLGDHGWHHLSQDLRDALAIAEGFNEGELNNTQRALLALTAAFHDIGYAADVVHLWQKEGTQHYDLDKGHPLLSLVFVQEMSDLFHSADDERLGLLTAKEFQALQAMVVNHENPERANMAKEYELLSKAFAQADALAAVGLDKLPPALGENPEFLQLAYLYNVGQSQVDALPLDQQPAAQEELEKQINQLKQKLKVSIEAKYSFDPKQAENYLNILTDSHLGKKSLKFLLGRMTGEATIPTVEESSDGTKKVAVRMNLGEHHRLNQFELSGAEQAAAKIAVKVLCEQSGIDPTDDEEAQLIAAITDQLGEEQLNLSINNQAVQVSTTVQDEGTAEQSSNLTILKTLETATFKLTVSMSTPAAQPANRAYYDQVYDQLTTAQSLLTSTPAVD